MILLWVKIFGTLHAEQLGAAAPQPVVQIRLANRPVCAARR